MKPPTAVTTSISKSYTRPTQDMHHVRVEHPRLTNFTTGCPHVLPRLTNFTTGCPPNGKAQGRNQCASLPPQASAVRNFEVLKTIECSEVSEEEVEHFLAMHASTAIMGDSDV